MIKINVNEEILRRKLVKLALLQHKKLYVHGQNGPDVFDCAGLVWFLYHELLDINLYYKGIGLSTTTKIMTGNYGKLTLFEESSKDKDLSIIRQGDVVLFHRQSLDDFKPKEDNKYPGHCGIYLGDYRFIHCSRPLGKVVISNFLKNEYWQRVLVGSKDVLSDDEALRRIKLLT